jgi:hypothetical protein
LALEAEKHRNPIQLKALLVQQLVQHSLDEDFPPAQRMKALQLIGQLFEVGAFLERKETTVVHKSTDIRTRLLERLNTTTVIDDGLTLMDEIRGDGALADVPARAPTAPVPALEAVPAVLCTPHTISDIQTIEKNDGGPTLTDGSVVNDFDRE